MTIPLNLHTHGIPFLLTLVLSLFGAPAIKSESKEGNSSVTAEGDAGSLQSDIIPVLAHTYPGIDTAALLARIQERQKWGEKNEKLIEAEGIIYWDRKDRHLAIPCFKRLSNPGLFAMGFLAEGLLEKGDKYEAAVWFLKAAKSASQKDPFTLSMYQRYLEIKPSDVQAEMEYANCLEQQLHLAEAGAIYWKHRELVVKNPQAALLVGTLLTSHGKMSDAAILYTRARELHPKDKYMSVRLAQVQETMGNRIESAKAWIEVWKLEPADTTSRNRALAILEASAPAGDSTLKLVLEKALEKERTSGHLHFKLAVVLLRAQDHNGAYSHLLSALKASPSNSTYLSRLPDAITGDSLIKANFSFLKTKFERDGSSVTLAALVARGYHLAGDWTKACRTWATLSASSPQLLVGRRDAFENLSNCTDPLSLALASDLGEKLLEKGFDREAARNLVTNAVHKKDFRKASDNAIRLVDKSPQDAPVALSAAKAMIAAGKQEEAKGVLLTIGKHAPSLEGALLLGRIYYGSKDYARASEQFLQAKDSFPEAAKLRGDCLAELKDYQGAIGEYEKYQARTGDKETFRVLARLYQGLGDKQKEMESLQSLYANGLAGEQEKLRVGNLLAAQGESKSALIIFVELFRTRTTLPQGEGWREAAILLGMHLAKEGDIDRAVRILTLGLTNAPAKTAGFTAGWISLGECYAEKRQWKDAWNAYAAAVAIDSTSGEAIAEMLPLARKLNSKKELSETYRHVYRLDSLDAEANVYLAAAHHSNREYRQAAVHYGRVAKSRPKDPKAWEDYGNTLAMIPNLVAASDPLQTAIDLGAQSVEVYINRARAYRREGAKDMAGSIMEYLLNRNNNDYLALFWAAKFAQEDGKQILAVDYFRKYSRLSVPRTSWPELLKQEAPAAKLSAQAD